MKILILGYISGKLRRSFIRILPGDRVKIEVSRYDSTRSRIIYRSATKVRKIRFFSTSLFLFLSQEYNSKSKIAINLFSSKKWIQN